jgi:cytochrome P450
LGALYWLIGGKGFKRACSTVHAFVDSIVQDALRASEETKSDVKYIILDALAQETRDSVVLRDQLLNVLLAGRDTTACLLSWTWFVVAARPLS